MHWTEVLAILIIVLALVPVFILLGYIIALARGGFRYWTELRRLDLGREYRCEQGTFVRKEHSWIGELEAGGARLTIDVRDEHGAPDAAFLRRLADIVAKLSQLEGAARRNVPELTNEYALESILSKVRLDDPYDFALGFSPKEENFEMSIYVNFREDRVAGWLGVD